MWTTTAMLVIIAATAPGREAAADRDGAAESSDVAGDVAGECELAAICGESASDRGFVSGCGAVCLPPAAFRNSVNFFLATVNAGAER